TWKFALAANPLVEGLILCLRTDAGVEGFGYASSTPHMGSCTEAMRAELEFLLPAIKGMDASNIEASLTKLDRMMRGAHQAKAAIDCALHDLLARSLNIPLGTLFGGRCRDSLPVLRILAIKAPEAMAEQAKKLVDRGIRYLKIKVE